LAFMPSPNTFTAVPTGFGSASDGLNTAAIRWLRSNRGADNLFGAGQEVGNRKQMNLRLDHNFSQNHKLNVSGSYERDFSTDSQPFWAGTFAGPAYRRPWVVTSGFTSTLSPKLVNEARFGIRTSGSNSTSPYDWGPNLAAVNKFLPPPVNGVRVLPRMGGG